MKTELSHDIIALKVWEKLPEQDKLLMQVRESFKQRHKDFLAETGSFLGEKELIAWEDFFPLLDLSEEQLTFIENSRKKIEIEQQQKEEQQQRELRLTQEKLGVETKARKRQQIFLLGLGILLLASIIIAIWAVSNQNKAKSQERIANEKEALAFKKQEEAEAITLELRSVLLDIANKDYQVWVEKALIAEKNNNFNRLRTSVDSALKVIESYSDEIKRTNAPDDFIHNFQMNIDSNGATVTALRDAYADESRIDDYVAKVNAIKKLKRQREYIKAKELCESVLNMGIKRLDTEAEMDRIMDEGFNHYRYEINRRINSVDRVSYNHAESIAQMARLLLKDDKQNRIVKIDLLMKEYQQKMENKK